MKIYKIIKKLKSIGYKFELKSNNKVKIKLKSENEKPDPEKVKPLLHTLKENKSTVIRILKNKEMLSSTPNWFVIRSDLIEEEKIFFRKNENIKIPHKFKELESYTYLEGKILLHDKDIDKKDLKKLHNTRKMFNGTLILADMEAVKNVE